MSAHGVLHCGSVIQAPRMSRKRQSRRFGTACKGRASTRNRPGACKQLVCIALDMGKSLSSEAELEWPIDYLQNFVTPVSFVSPPLEEDALVPDPLSSHRKHVRFDLAATIMHEVPPYAEIYGAHPRTFVFDRDSQMIPAARGGYVSVASTTDPFEDLDYDDCEPSEDDGDWSSWLIEQDGLVDSGEPESKTPLGFTHDSDTCLPDLDDEQGWDAWLESALGSTEHHFSDDSIHWHGE